MPYRPKHQRHLRLRGAIRLAIAAVVLILLAYPLLEPYMLRVESTNLSDPSLPEGVGRLRIVYVSDIHEGGFPFFTHSRTVDLVRKINALNADLVLLGGDYADSTEGAIAFFGAMPRLRANYGVYGIVGDSDRTEATATPSALRDAMRAAGVTPLVNETASVRIGTNDIFLVGVDDVDNGFPDLSGLAKKVSADDYVILLSHSPAVIPETLGLTDKSGRKSWYDLGLFGHTHGGQMALAGGLLGISKVDARYQRGWQVENKIHLLISNGIGTSVLPMRLLCPPQIHLITVTAGK